MPKISHAREMWQWGKKNALNLDKTNKDHKAKSESALKGFDEGFGPTLDKLTKALKDADTSNKPADNQLAKQRASEAIKICDSYKVKVAEARKKGDTPGLKWLHDVGLPKMHATLKQYVDKGKDAGWPDL